MAPLIAEISAALDGRWRYEIIYVDDGSRDESSAVARTLPALPLDVQVVTLSRNFGKEAALLAGLDHARLGAVLFMDADGQHSPDLIETLVLLCLMFSRHGGNPRRFGDVGDNAMYWNFVVATWIPLYLCIYWIPRL